MKAVCPYCEKVFEKRRRNQLYCHTYCRQGDYHLRKAGRKVSGIGAIRSLSVEETYDAQNVENPSKRQSVKNGREKHRPIIESVSTSSHKIVCALTGYPRTLEEMYCAHNIEQPSKSQSVEKNREKHSTSIEKASDSMPKSVGLATGQPQNVDKTYDAQNVENPSKGREGNKAGKWQVQAMARQYSAAKPEIHPTDHLRENQNVSTAEHKKSRKFKKRSQWVRRFEAPDEYWKRNIGVNGQETNTATNPNPQPETITPPPPVQDNYPPIEQIPPQAPKQPLTEYMAKHGLTHIVMPKDFTANLFPHWNEKEKLAFTILNDKVAEALRLLVRANERTIKTDYLKEVYKKLHEITTGIYRLFMPAGYPLLRFLQLVELKLKKMIEKIDPTVEFVYELDEQFRNQVVFVCLQAENAEYLS